MLHSCSTIFYASILHLLLVFVIHAEKINIKPEICFWYFHEYCSKLKKKTTRKKPWETTLGVKNLQLLSCLIYSCSFTIPREWVLLSIICKKKMSEGRGLLLKKSYETTHVPSSHTGIRTPDPVFPSTMINNNET